MEKTHQNKTESISGSFLANPIRSILDIPHQAKDYVYRWVNLKKFQNMGNMDSRGFEIDHDCAIKGRVFQENEDSKTTQRKYRDSMVVRGDLVLGKMHINVAQKIRDYIKFKKEKKLEGIGSPSLKSSGLQFAAPTVEAIGKVGQENINVTES